ncbi:hypothetical protein WA1_37075 [Scytonema hofmannii PCC 7110]|uniref:Uncharacterized protein n=1 Tax=Scytonema hofmannii PCC 7110 TaxID=128403 RepID=A0A139X163_9CYAN|nr:hypothetical protein [Scytonema hofmannii]KYC38396.1 hypothetical protein WA1_37075 [Scytonema hofmannii PCC 7110]
MISQSLSLAFPPFPTFNLEQTLQGAEQIKNATSQSVQTAISSSLNHWFEQHPILFKLVQLLEIAAHHPIISIVILLVAFSIIGSFVKAISRFIEAASLSLLQLPFRGLQFLVKLGLQSFSNIGGSDAKQVTSIQMSGIPSLPPEKDRAILKDKQQRLADISIRLEEIQKEQNKLLQEVAEILGSSDQ